MVMTDPSADFLIRIKNGYQAGKKTIEVPYSKLKDEIGQVLLKEGFIKGIEVVGKKPQEKKLVLALKYKQKKPVLRGVKRISKSSVRIYAQAKKIPRVYWGFGITILSTPQGVMTDKQALKKKIGGEVICQVW